jgi:hypothetical protein
VGGKLRRADREKIATMIWPPPSVRFEIQLPNDAAGSFTLMEDSARPNTITLKRGFLMRDSELYRWCRAGGHDERTLRINLVNDARAETTSWTLANAILTAFVLIDDATDHVLVETIGFRCDSITQSP